MCGCYPSEIFLSSGQNSPGLSVYGYLCWMDSSEGEDRGIAGLDSDGEGDVRGRERERKRGKREPRLDYGPVEPRRAWGEGGSGRRV